MLKGYLEFFKTLGHESLSIRGGSDSLKRLALLGLVQRNPEGTILIVLPSVKDFAPWFAFCEQTIVPAVPGLGCATLPHFGLWGQERYLNINLLKQQRLMALDLLANDAGTKIVIATLPGLAQRAPTREGFRSRILAIEKGSQWEPLSLAEQLVERGYQRVSQVEERGTFAIRGGVLDLYGIGHARPVRFEFFDDRIETLKTFSPRSQRSLKEIESVHIAQASDILLPAASRKADTQRIYDALLQHDIATEDRNGMVASFSEGIRFSGIDMFAPLFLPENAAAIDYLPSDTKLFFPEAQDRCWEAFEGFVQDTIHFAELDKTAKRAVISPLEHFRGAKKIEDALHPFPAIDWGSLFSGQHRQVTLDNGCYKQSKPETKPAEAVDAWLQSFSAILENGGHIVVTALGQEERDKLEHLFKHRDFKTEHSAFPLAALHTSGLKAGIIYIVPGVLPDHVWDEIHNVLIMDHHILLGVPEKAKKTFRKLKHYFTSFKDLKVDDLVVHVTHGIGRYLGISGLNVGGVTNDFLIVQYQGGDRIYLPVDRLDQLQKYRDSSEQATTRALDKLGGTAWVKKKSQVREAVKDIAQDLLRTHAKRKLSRAFQYTPPDGIYHQFVDDFPYNETEDQARSISEVEDDLTSGRLMDRLLIGDVGFGKTEVALRAAMRVVIEGRQVLVLVPTTVLCYQQFQVFRNRMDKHGIRIAQINRYVKTKDQKAVTEALIAGTVDIVVGTHRLLSKDVKPRNLGLIIVDEEQRFGVVQKERLKELRSNTDILTMSATPIPRTLHLAMLGIRDISVIATPPVDRLPVRTIVSKFDELLMVEAITNEINRGGQVFFVHNRVEDISAVAGFIKEKMPAVSLRVAHGQMKSHQLEDAFLDFVEQKFQVLVCTTIIESGIDMPRVNTLIVNKADHFGLAQLYQLRGRVGRSSVQAYAYFFTTQGQVADDARRRLELLATYQELGAGFQIAQHDSELRGVGDLLGQKQSGNMATVGYDLYMEMLNDVLTEVSGSNERPKVDPELKIKISAIISPKYIEQENERLQFYKRIFSADSPADLTSLLEETEDRFGDAPIEFKRLIKVALLKIALKAIDAVLLIAVTPQLYEVRFGPLQPAMIEKLRSTAQGHNTQYQLTSDFRLMLRLTSGTDQDSQLEGLLTLIDPLALAY